MLLAGPEVCETLPTGGIHVCAGTHSVAAVASLQKLHKLAGQILIAAPVLGRPDVVASGNATIAAIGEMDWDRLAGLADFDWHAVVLDQELDLLGEIGRKRSGRVTVVSCTPGPVTKP